MMSMTSPTHLSCVSIQNWVISIVISMLLEGFCRFFRNLSHRWISVSRFPAGVMTSPPAATAALHRGSSGVNWLPWLSASWLMDPAKMMVSVVFQTESWGWGKWNSFSGEGGEDTFLLIFFVGVQLWKNIQTFSVFQHIFFFKEPCWIRSTIWMQRLVFVSQVFTYLIHLWCRWLMIWA